MRTQTSNDVFYVTFSKWKVWGHAIVCWIIACIPMLPIALHSWGAMTGEVTGESPLTLNDIAAFAILASISLLFVALPFIFLTRINKPMATLTREGFSGRKTLKDYDLKWAPDTVIFGVKGNTMLTTPDHTQSRSSKLWSGTNAIRVHNRLTKTTREEVLEAIERLAPYPVKTVSLSEANK